MRKKAQERKRSSSSPSPSSSSSISDPPLEVGVEKHERDGVIEGTSLMTAGLEENGEGAPKGYPIDQIWNDIATSELVCELSFEGYKDEAGDFSCPPVSSPMWDFSNSDSLWKMDDEEFKTFAPIPDDTIRES